MSPTAITSKTLFFWSGLESEDTALLQELAEALTHPVFRCTWAAVPARPPCRSAWACGSRALQEALQAEPPPVPGTADPDRGWMPTRWSRAASRSGMCR